MIMEYKKNVPSHINKLFKRRAVDAAFISSIKAKNERYANLGIIAKKEVLSVIVIPHESNKKDTASATSNHLATILGVEGEVLIGDKALKYYLTGKEHIDLAKVWNERYHLPFVFAVLTYHKDQKKIKVIEKEFSKKRIKIPQYILKNASTKTQIAQKDILEYLTKISYSLDIKAKKGLKKFYSLS